MAAEPGPGWERAKREVFDPLMEKNAKRWGPEVETVSRQDTTLRTSQISSRSSRHVDNS